jgi:uncharacterized protein YeaC (DUF1315 family)
MDYQSLIDQLTPDVVARLRQGIETGQWPDGQSVTPEQREHSLRAVIAWEQLHLPEEERVGFIDKGRKAGISAADQTQAEEQLKWVSQDGDSKQ